MEIPLDGAEITVLKAIGLGGGEIDGETLLERAVGLEAAEVIEAVQGLVMLGYVVSDIANFGTADELKRGHYHVNSGYSKQLKQSMDPTTDRKPKRVRRE